MATSTPNLQLLKPAATEVVNVQTALNDNWDKVDDALLPILTETEARYESSSATAINNFALTDIAFQTVKYATDLVTPDGTFKAWTLNKTGVWVVNSRVSFDGGTPSGAGNYLLRCMDGAKAVTYDSDLQPADERSLRLATEFRANSGTVLKFDANVQVTEASRDATGWVSFRWVKE